MGDLPLFARLILCCALTLGLTIAEFLLSHYTHSISLLVLANHSFYNLLTLGFGATSIALMKSNAKSLTSKSTYGWNRMEVVGSLSSLVFLASLCFGTAIEALQTILHSGHLDLMHQPINVFILACVHVLIWLLVLTFIGGYTHYQWRCLQYESKLPEKRYVAPYFKEIRKKDLIRDLASCGLLMVTSGLVASINEARHPRAIKFVDPCIALISILVIVITSLPLMKRLSMVLLQGTPINTASLKQDILKEYKDGIFDIHELHIWSLMHGQTVANLHVTYKDQEAFLEIQGPLRDFLTLRGISQVTIQPEFSSTERKVETKEVCHLLCKEAWCAAQRCCLD